MNRIKKLFTIAAATIAMCYINACGASIETIKPSKNIVTQSVSLAGFNSLELVGPINVVYETGNTGKADIKGSDNLVSLVTTDVSGGKLSIRFKKNIRISGNSNVTVYVSAPAATAYSITGSGNISIKQGINLPSKDVKLKIIGLGNISVPAVQCRSLICSISGSGNIACKSIGATSTKASVTGSGNIAIDGSTQEASLSISGSGSINAGKLASKQADASISGSGAINCNVTGSLDASISGSGSIRYAGNPQKVHKGGIFKNKIRPAK